MSRPLNLLLVLWLGLLCTCCSSPEAGGVREGAWRSLFDGQTLDGWEGDPIYWWVANGIMTGEVTPETLLNRNSFLIWRGGTPADFELTVDYRISARGNSGINYRSEPVEGLENALRGYQADMDGAQHYSGMNYEERGRTTIAARGERVRLPPLPTGNDSLAPHIVSNQWAPRRITASLGDPGELRQSIRDEDWNTYRLDVRGNHLRHYINGVLMSEVTDEDTAHRKSRGLLGVQVHVGPPMKVEYRNWRLREF